MPGSSNCSHFFRFSHQDLLRISLLPLTCHIPLTSQPNSFDDPNRISSLRNVLQPPANSSSLGSTSLRQNLTRKYQILPNQVRNQNFSHWGGGWVLTLRLLYNLSLIQIICYKTHVVNITVT
jgi:hypothetical protein